MCKVIGIWNIKGGEGKTTTALNLGIGLGNKGKKVLLVDIDPQANLSSSLIAEEMKKESYKSMTDLFIPNSTTKAREAIYPSDYGVDVLGCNLALTNAEIVVRANPMINQNHILKNIIAEIEHDYDFIIIDCPPALNLLTMNMAMIANIILTTVSSDEWSFDGYKATAENIQIINKNFGTNIRQKILFTKVTRTKVDKDTISSIKEHSNWALDTTIRNQPAIMKKGGDFKIVVNAKEKNRKGEPIPDVGTDYRNLVQEILDRVERGDF